MPINEVISKVRISPGIDNGLTIELTPVIGNVNFVIGYRISFKQNFSFINLNHTAYFGTDFMLIKLFRGNFSFGIFGNLGLTTDE